MRGRIFAENVTHIFRISVRPAYYHNANRITVPRCHGVAESREQICRLPSGTRLPSILLAERNAKGDGWGWGGWGGSLFGGGFSRIAGRRYSPPRRSRSFPYPLKRAVAAAARQKDLAVVRGSREIPCNFVWRIISAVPFSRSRPRVPSGYYSLDPWRIAGESYVKRSVRGKPRAQSVHDA